MSYQRLLDKVEGSTSGGAEGLDHCFRPLLERRIGGGISSNRWRSSMRGSKNQYVLIRKPRMPSLCA